MMEKTDLGGLTGLRGYAMGNEMKVIRDEG